MDWTRRNGIAKAHPLRGGRCTGAAALGGTRFTSSPAELLGVCQFDAVHFHVREDYEDWWGFWDWGMHMHIYLDVLCCARLRVMIEEEEEIRESVLMVTSLVTGRIWKTNAWNLPLPRNSWKSDFVCSNGSRRIGVLRTFFRVRIQSIAFDRREEQAN